MSGEGGALANARSMLIRTRLLSFVYCSTSFPLGMDGRCVGSLHRVHDLAEVERGAPVSRSCCLGGGRH
jgi:hypothetical protein